MKTPDYLVKAPIDSPNRNGFSMPFENRFSGECGTLYPILMKEMIPNETVSLSLYHEVELPPMVSNFFGRIDMIYEAFFVPYSLLWGGWEQFAMHPTHNPIYPDGTPVSQKPTSIPSLVFNSTEAASIGTMSLSNFLGVKETTVGIGYSVNILPFLCYHRIYDDWYRNTVVQTKIFGEPGSHYSGTATNLVSYLPHVTAVVASIGNSSIDNTDTVVATTSAANFFDGINVTGLRQRNFALDYFTAATPQPQAGNASTIEFTVDTETGEGEISIAAIRSANAIQQWKERNNIVGYDYYSQMHAQHGIYPRMRKLDKCIYLGRIVEPVYNRSVFNTAVDSVGAESANPFMSLGDGVGTRFGASQANGRGNLFSNFTTFDYGFICVMASMRPQASYSTGIDKKLETKYIGDIAFPLLSSIGDQPIYAREIGASTGASTDVFGWTDRYAQHKCYQDEVHGELTPNGALAPFVLQRSFSTAQINSDFLEIPKDFLEQVRQQSKDIVTSDYWASVYFDFKKVSTLPRYSVPTLGDLRNAHTEMVRRGGSQL